MAQSLFKQIKTDCPDAVIDVLAPEWSIPLIRRMPEIQKGISLPIGHGSLRLSTRMRKAKILARKCYDRAIILPATWKSALVPFFAKIPIRTGFLGEFRYGLVNDIRALDKTVLNMTVLRYLALGDVKNGSLPPEIRFYPELDVDRQNRDRMIRYLGLTLDRPVICFCPGAEYGPAKQWPPAFYRELADMLIANGYQIWTIGSRKEAGIASHIHPGHAGEFYRNLCGKTRLEDVVDLISLAACVVTNDSGLMHVAAASGVLVQAIYGSSTPSYTPPLTTQADIHYRGLNCSPCFKRKCPLGHLRCLKEILPWEVYHSIEKRLRH